jgi:hypothetical protein
MSEQLAKQDDFQFKTNADVLIANIGFFKFWEHFTLNVENYRFYFNNSAKYLENKQFCETCSLTLNC